jgi:hypothetical protein
MDEIGKLIAELEADLAALTAKLGRLKALCAAAPARDAAGLEAALEAELAADLEPETAPAPEAPDGEAPAEAAKPLLPPGPLADFVATLRSIKSAFEAGGLPVDPKDVAFIDKVETVLAGLGEEERSGPKGGRVLFDCLRFLDVLRVNYDLPPYAEVGKRIFEVATGLLTSLENERGFEIFPRPLEEHVSAVQGRIKAYAKAVAEHKIYSSRPEGTIVGVLQRGALLSGKPLAGAKILVSRGEEHPLNKLGRKTLGTLLHAAPRIGEGGFKAATEVRKLLLRFGSGQDEEAVTARYVLNAVHEHDKGGVFKKLVKELLEHMRSLGYVEIIATVGKVFDESYSPSKYDRRKVRSSEPAGTIVAVLRRGFLDRSGVPVQKALVAVSGG